jgi:hypothetical protein
VNILIYVDFFTQVGSDGPPFVCSSLVSGSCSALLWRFYRRSDTKGHLSAVCLLLMNCPYIGHLRYFYMRGGGCCERPTFHFVHELCGCEGGVPSWTMVAM